MDLPCWYQLNGKAYGPVSFDVLAHMVREVELDSDDLVCMEGQTSWCRASDLIGIVYLSETLGSGPQNRESLVQQLDEIGVKCRGVPGSRDFGVLALSDFDEMLSRAEIGGAEETQANLSEVESDEPMPGDATPQGLQRIRGEIRKAVREAVSKNVKQAAMRRSQLRAAASRLFTKSTLRVGFRWGVTMAVVVVIGSSLEKWSERQLLRYPDRRLLELGAEHFPLWGWCSGDEFMLLMINTLIIAGFAAYFAAAYVESLADD